MQDLVYDPGLLGNQMNRTTFGQSFTDLTEVVATVASASLPETDVVTVFDSHAYDAYS